MTDFAKCLEEAHHRVETTDIGDSDWRGVYDFYDTIRKDHRRAQLLAKTVAVAVISGPKEASGNEDRERRIANAERLRQRGIKTVSLISNNDLDARGWVLAEGVRPRVQAEPAMAGNDLPPRLRGLLLSNRAEIWAYGKDLTDDYPKKKGTDTWGHVVPNLYAGSNLIVGDTKKIDLSLPRPLDVVGCDAAIREISGSLSLHDLVAGLAVSYKLNEAALIEVANQPVH
jgi:hypothetical protein